MSLTDNGCRLCIVPCLVSVDTTLSAYLARIVPDGAIDNNLDLPFGQIALRVQLALGFGRCGRHEAESGD